MANAMDPPPKPNRVPNGSFVVGGVVENMWCIADGDIDHLEITSPRDVADISIQMKSSDERAYLDHKEFCFSSDGDLMDEYFYHAGSEEKVLLSAGGDIKGVEFQFCGWVKQINVDSRNLTNFRINYPTQPSAPKTTSSETISDGKWLKTVTLSLEGCDLVVQIKTDVYLGNDQPSLTPVSATFGKPVPPDDEDSDSDSIAENIFNRLGTEDNDMYAGYHSDEEERAMTYFSCGMNDPAAGDNAAIGEYSGGGDDEYVTDPQDNLEIPDEEPPRHARLCDHALLSASLALFHTNDSSSDSDNEISDVL